MTFEDEIARLLAEKERKIYARYPCLTPAPRPASLAGRTDPRAKTLTLGRSAEGKVSLPGAAWLTHMHAVGTTGSGKTNMLLHMTQQIAARGFGLCLFDPHGNHPDSLYRRLLTWLDRHGFTKGGRVHVLDPNAPSHVVGFNPLGALDDGTDLSVLADTLLEAFERVWNEDMHGKPTTRTVLKATFMALAELGLTLAEAKLLYDANDQHGVRERVIGQLVNEYAQDELSRLHETARGERSKHDFRAEVVGPINRLNDFVSAEAAKVMLGQTERRLDLTRILDDGHILLVNLQDGTRISDANARLLGAILLRYLFFSACRRVRTALPYFLVIDECQNFLSGDIPKLLAEARKYGLGVTLAHQAMYQLGEPGDDIHEAIANCTNVKAVFRVASPREAQQLAETVIPLDLELPVQALVKPAAVAQEVVRLRSESSARHSSESIARATAEALAEMEGRSESTASAASTGQGVSQAFDFAGQGWAPASEALAQTLSASSGASELNGSATMQAVTKSVANSIAKSLSEGKSVSEGASEALRTVYQDLPGAVHSKENVLYMAGEAIRRLPAGAAFCAYGDRAAQVQVPLVTAEALPEPRMAALIERVLAASPYATPGSEAAAAVKTRRARLLAAPVSAIEEPDFLERESISSPLDDAWVDGFWERMEGRIDAERNAKESANDNEPSGLQ